MPPKRAALQLLRLYSVADLGVALCGILGAPLLAAAAISVAAAIGRRALIVAHDLEPYIRV